MSKFYKKNKKLVLCLFLVMALTISNYAAVVSDNDGSAFITKAEFEALKNDFADQVLNYNNSIDGKIDGAIASYLAGIRLSKKEDKKLFFYDWEKVTMLNTAIENVWKCPDVNLSLTFGSATPLDGSYGYTGWATRWWAIGAISYARSDTNYAKRLVVDAGPENNANDYAIWMGRSCNLVDSIKLSRIVTCYKGGADLGHLAYPQSSGQTQTFSFTNATQIQPGYYADLDTLERDIWAPRFRWISNRDGYEDYSDYDDCISKSNSFSIDLKPVSNKIYEFEHVLNWENYTWPQVTDVDWTKSLRTMEVPSGATPTYTRKWLLTNATKNGKWSGQTSSGKVNNTRRNGEIQYGSVPITNFSSYWSGNYNVDDNTSFVGVGLVNKTYDSEHIYQSDKTFSDTVGQKDYSANKVSLIGGMPLLAANIDDIVTIDLEFDNGYRNGTAVSDMNCDVFLSLVPFGTGSNVSDATKRIKCKNQPDGQDYMRTTNNKIQLEWTMPEDGIVYIKWRPSDTTGTWQVDLDLKKNPTYTVESAT